MDGTIRCQRPHCGGTLVDFGDGTRCALCGRGPIRDGPSALLLALMREPPGPFKCFGASPADILGFADLSDPQREPRPGRKCPGPKPTVGLEIKWLAEQGWTTKDIVAEGRRRKVAGERGWVFSSVYRVIGV